jgi:dTDP-4-amino-4,6-dideoxygalactose transaminase
LRKANGMLAMRRAIAARYNEAFCGDFILPPDGPGNAWYLYPLRLKAAENVRAERDKLIEKLQGEGIGVSVHFIPLHLMPYYKERYGLRAEDLPETVKRFEQSLSLPIWPGMNSGQIDRVIAAVKEYGAGKKRVR